MKRECKQKWEVILLQSTKQTTTTRHKPSNTKKMTTYTVGNKRQRIPKGQSKKGNNPDKLATKATQDEEKQNKNITQYVLDTTIRKQTQIM